MHGDRRNLSPVSVQSFWQELSSIEKTAGLADIVAAVLRKASANKAADAILEYGDRASDLAVKALLTELPGPRILPRNLLAAGASMFADNPHVAPALLVPVPGSTEATLAATAAAEKLLGASARHRPGREEILQEFMSRKVPLAPWVEPTEHYSERVHEDLSNLKKRLAARLGAKKHLKPGHA